MEFSVIGGDTRQRCLAELLRRDGHCVKTAALGVSDVPAVEAAKARNVILPLPLSSDGVTLNTPFSDKKLPLRELFRLFNPGTAVFAGKVGKEAAAMASDAGAELADYFEREDFTVRNAALTAEGAVGLLMRQMPLSLAGLKCLVIGFGRIGKALALKLTALGAKVTVSARKSSDFAWIQSIGCTAADTRRLKEILSGFDAVINTVPAPVLMGAELKIMKRDCFCMDLASLPGGVDFAAAAELGIKTAHELSVPGRMLPLSAAEALRDTIYNIISERGKMNE